MAEPAPWERGNLDPRALSEADQTGVPAGQVKVTNPQVSDSSGLAAMGMLGSAAFPVLIIFFIIGGLVIWRLARGHRPDKKYQRPPLSKAEVGDNLHHTINHYLDKMYEDPKLAEAVAKKLGFSLLDSDYPRPNFHLTINIRQHSRWYKFSLPKMKAMQEGEFGVIDINENRFTMPIEKAQFCAFIAAQLFLFQVYVRCGQDPKPIEDKTGMIRPWAEDILSLVGLHDLAVAKEYPSKARDIDRDLAVEFGLDDRQIKEINRHLQNKVDMHEIKEADIVIEREKDHLRKIKDMLKARIGLLRSLQDSHTREVKMKIALLEAEVPKITEIIVGLEGFTARIKQLVIDREKRKKDLDEEIDRLLEELWDTKITEDDLAVTIISRMRTKALAERKMLEEKVHDRIRVRKALRGWASEEKQDKKSEKIEKGRYRVRDGRETTLADILKSEPSLHEVILKLQEFEREKTRIIQLLYQTE